MNKFLAEEGDCHAERQDGTNPINTAAKAKLFSKFEDGGIEGIEKKGFLNQYTGSKNLGKREALKNY